MAEIINILCAADEDFLPYCGIMLTSMFETNNREHFRVFIIIPELLPLEKLEKFNELAMDYNHKIEFIKVDPLQFSFCPIREGDKVSLAAYYRILATEILPEDIDKVIYLDCDIIINGEINTLYKIDLKNHSCAVVIDPIYCRNEEYSRLKYSKELSYFNSGVMLINLEFWRLNKITKVSFDFIKNYPNRIIWHDQDVLNFILRNSKILVDPTYNFQSQFLYKRKIWGEFEEPLLNRINDIINEGPVIIHYSNEDKPWIVGSMHPYVKFFEYFENLSKWKNSCRINKKRKKTLKVKIYEVLVFLGLKKKYTRYLLYPLDVSK